MSVDGQAPEAKYAFTFENGINSLKIYNAAPRGPTTIEMSFSYGVEHKKTIRDYLKTSISSFLSAFNMLK